MSFTCCPAYGTYISQFCSGYNLYFTYADGSCGQFDSLMATRSSTCGHSGCTTYNYTWYGYETWYDCDGNSNYEYLTPYDSRCIDNNYGAGGYWSSTYSACV